MRAVLAALLAVLPLQGAAGAGFETWSDSVVGHAVEEGRASGAAVAIVSEGETVFLKGYGADREAKVSPDATTFSIGSITKSFTATAVAQLLEAGRIGSLDDPANDYLKRVQLPAWKGRDISVRDLLTHRAGFDDSTYGLATAVPVETPLPPETIEERIPPLMRAPGEVSVYSNNGYAMLGVLIEDVTGETYADYIAKNVFAPLGMDDSFVRTRPDEPIALPMTQHADGSRTPIPQGWAYHPYIAPSAAIISTAEDMARFAAAQMKAEGDGAAGITGAQTARLMHGRLVENAPEVTGFGMSFVVSEWNGERIVENAGSGPGFQANFILLPDRDLALVVLMMGGYAGPSPMAALTTRLSEKEADKKTSLNMFSVRRSFLERTLGAYEPAEAEGALPSVKKFEGLYRAARRPASTVEALFNPGAVIDARAGADGTLIINGEPGYRQTAPGRFFRADATPYVPDAGASDLYVFVEDGEGAIDYVATHIAIEVFESARFSPGAARTAGLVGALLALCGFAGLFWRAKVGTAHIARALAIVAGITVAAIAGVFLIGPGLNGNPAFALAFGDMRLLFILAALATFLVVTTAALAIASVAAGATPMTNVRRVWLASTVIGGALVSASLGYFNLVGYHFP